MTGRWPSVPLGQIVCPVAREETPLAGRTYRQIGVRLWGEGAYERQELEGAATRYAALYRCDEGDLVVNKIWARNGAAAVVPSTLAGAYGSSEFPTFQPIRDRVLPGWLHWQTKRKRFWEQCDEKSRGTSGKNRIRPERLLEVEIPLPPLPEQRRIILLLDALAQRIEEAELLQVQVLEGVKNLDSAAFGRVFGQLTNEGPILRLAELVNESGYGTSTKSLSERQPGAVPVLRIPNVAAGSLDLRNLKFSVLSQGELQKYALADGDLLIVRTNGSLDLVGRCAVVRDLPEAAAFASYLIRLRLRNELADPDFVRLALGHLRRTSLLVEFARTTAGQYNVSLGRLETLELPVPALKVQRQIVQRFSLVSEGVQVVAAEVTTALDELRGLRCGILERLVGGSGEGGRV